jgi:hypothetical protein
MSQLLRKLYLGWGFNASIQAKFKAQTEFCATGLTLNYQPGCSDNRMAALRHRHV